MPKKNKSKTKSKLIGIRFYPGEFKELEKLADSYNLSVVDFCRNLIRNRLHQGKMYQELANQKKNSLDFTTDIELMQDRIAKLTKIGEKTLELVQKNREILNIKSEFPVSNKTDTYIQKYEDKIKEIIRKEKGQGKSMTLEAIHSHLDIPEDVLFEVLISSDAFKTINGGWTIYE
jgi:hypothetical protein